MRKHQIEAWALDVIERVEKGQPIEDSRVELKAVWIEPEKAARRLAGHANAARGESILWLIGVDQHTGVVGVDYQEFSTWYAQVGSQFDELAPTVVDLNVPHAGKTVVALLFETDRAPYVVKNPLHGRVAGDPASLETPWREATAVKSATRSQLLRLLSPLQNLPEVEVLGASLSALWYPDFEAPRELLWQLEVRFYAVPMGDRRIVIPNHRCSASFQIEGAPEVDELGELSFGSTGESQLTKGTGTEAILDGPGPLMLTGNTKTPLLFTHPANQWLRHELIRTTVRVTLSLRPVGVESRIEHDISLRFVHEQNAPIVAARWTLRREDLRSRTS